MNNHRATQGAAQRIPGGTVRLRAPVPGRTFRSVVRPVARVYSTSGIVTWGASYAASRIRRAVSRGFARVPGRCATECRSRAVSGTERPDADDSQAAARLWHGGTGDTRTRRGGHLPRRLYRCLAERHLRAPRLPEEITAWGQDGSPGPGTDSRPPGLGPAIGRRNRER